MPFFLLVIAPVASWWLRSLVWFISKPLASIFFYFLQNEYIYHLILEAVVMDNNHINHHAPSLSLYIINGKTKQIPLFLFVILPLLLLLISFSISIIVIVIVPPSHSSTSKW